MDKSEKENERAKEATLSTRTVAHRHAIMWRPRLIYTRERRGHQHSEKDGVIAISETEALGKES